MTELHRPHPRPEPPSRPAKNSPERPQAPSSIPAIQDTISNLEHLSDYDIRLLVKQSEILGKDLRAKDLQNSQIRKFLDAINQIKIKSASQDFADIEDDIVLLKPKLAYAAAKQKSVKRLDDVISAAIDIVHTLDDFKRLVQLIESIIAYHRAS